MVNRSVAKRAKHAKPALRKGYWAKSGSSVLAMVLAASLVPVAPAMGDEDSVAVSTADVERADPSCTDAADSVSLSEDTSSEILNGSEDQPLPSDPAVSEDPSGCVEDSGAPVALRCPRTRPTTLWPQCRITLGPSQVPR